MEGARIVLAGEYQKMQQTFRFQAMGMVGAVLLIYFLMVALFRSYLTPLVVLSAVPVGLIGVILMLYFTGTALNVQSLLGVIFMVGIVVSNTVLLIDFAENVRKTDRVTRRSDPRRRGSRAARGHDGIGDVLRPHTDVSGLEPRERSERPLGPRSPGRPDRRAVTTLFVVPCVYSLLVPNKLEEARPPIPG